MSYDVLIFDPAHAPAEREAFLQWWDAHEWSSEPHPHNDPAFTTPNLRAWFLEMIERFPALTANAHLGIRGTGCIPDAMHRVTAGSRV